ncbi:toprim domain-containing protein [Kribbella sp. NPDC059898]|uniref:toprim domain-containing protein n=1 Tax=Kribbella sp. NPDC059898 TaxID=3346995 RepID=UPI00366214FD
MAFYRQELVDSPSGWAMEHLRNRGLGAVVEPDSTWSVGYAPDGWSRLVGHLRKEGFVDTEIVAAGLAFVTSNGYLVDRFRDRIVFAAHDSELRPAGFIGRSDGTRLRYLNTRSTEIYSKARTLVGLDAQLARLGEGAVPVFVEGPMDAPAISLAGDEWAGAACCGTAITWEQAVMARRCSRTGTAIVALDGDLGGRMGAVRSLSVLAAVFDEVLLAYLPDRQDPAALHAAGGGRLRDVLRSAAPLVDFAIEIELAKWDNVLDHLSGQVNAVRAVAPLVASMPATRIAGEIAKLARAVHLDEQIVSNEVIATVGRRGRCGGRRLSGRAPARNHDVEPGPEQADYSRSP